MGKGRDIPVKQGMLYKRSSKSLNKVRTHARTVTQSYAQEWKKKFVCLYANGRLVYHNNTKDYMDNVIGKEVYLPLATVKLSNQRRPRHPRAHQPPPMTNETDSAGLLLDLPCSSGAEEPTRDGHAVGGVAVSGGGLNNATKKEKYKHKHKRMGSGLKGIEDGACVRARVHMRFVLQKRTTVNL